MLPTKHILIYLKSQQVISVAESVVSVIERRNSFDRQQQPEVVGKAPVTAKSPIEQVVPGLNPPQRPPRTPSPLNTRRLSDIPRSVTGVGPMGGMAPSGMAPSGMAHSGMGPPLDIPKQVMTPPMAMQPPSTTVSIDAQPPVHSKIFSLCFFGGIFK